MTWHWSLDKTRALIALAWFIIGGICGFFMGKAVYNQPIEESVVRDTVRITDTIPHYYPQPVDGTVVRYITKYLPTVKTDTVFRENSVSSAKFSVNFPQDSVAVEVPITSKHYQAAEYDAWVSGFEPSLDSIKVYQRTEYITERVAISKPPNKFELDVIGGVDYNINNKRYTPYAGGELMYKPNRLQVGIRGGVEYTDKVEPVIGGVVKIRIY